MGRLPGCLHLQEKRVIRLGAKDEGREGKGWTGRLLAAGPGDIPGPEACAADLGK